MAKQQHLTVVHAEDEVDLRTVVSQSAYLRRVAAKYNLKPFECVCFTNKARTRFRLVFKISSVGDKNGPGMIFMCIPEIDQKSKYSVYLRISESLAELSGLARVQTVFNDLSEYTRERMRRAAKRRKSKRG